MYKLKTRNLSITPDYCYKIIIAIILFSTMIISTISLPSLAEPNPDTNAKVKKNRWMRITGPILLGVGYGSAITTATLFPDGGGLCSSMYGQITYDNCLAMKRNQAERSPYLFIPLAGPILWSQDRDSTAGWTAVMTSLQLIGTSLLIWGLLSPIDNRNDTQLTENSLIYFDHNFVINVFPLSNNKILGASVLLIW